MAEARTPRQKAAAQFALMPAELAAEPGLAPSDMMAEEDDA
jgi:hypothetical protein